MRILPSILAALLVALCSSVVSLHAKDPATKDGVPVVTNDGTIYLTGLDPNIGATTLSGATFDVTVNGTTSATVLDGSLNVGTDPNAAAVTITGGNLKLTGTATGTGTVTLTGGTLNFLSVDPTTGRLS